MIQVDINIDISCSSFVRFVKDNIFFNCRIFKT